MLAADGDDKFPLSWSPDGRSILYASTGGSKQVLWALPLAGDRKPFPFAQSGSHETMGQSLRMGGGLRTARISRGGSKSGLRRFLDQGRERRSRPAACSSDIPGGAAMGKSSTTRIPTGD